MPVSADFSLDTTNQIIKHVSGTEVYTANQLYSQIQNWMDDSAYMDFLPPMSAQTPTDYQIINGWYLDEGCIEWLNHGAITTNGYASAIYRLTFSASAGAVSGDIGLLVHNGGSTNTGILLAYNSAGTVWWVRKVAGTITTEALTITGGTGAGTPASVATGEMAFPNFYTLGSIDTVGAEQQIYLIQNQSHVKIWGAAGNADPTPDVNQHIDVLVKTKEAGVNIDSGNVTLFLRNYPAAGYVAATHQVDLYDHFALSNITTGRNAVPLATSNDLNNTTATATVLGYGTGANKITVAFINGTITHGSITSGPFTELEVVTQAVSSATALFVSESGGVMTLANVQGTFNNTNVISGATASTTSTGTLTLTNATRVVAKAFTQQSPNNYSIIIDCGGTKTLAQVYEYLKYVTRGGETTFYTYGITTPDSTTSGQVATINRITGEQYITPMINTVTAANTFAASKPSPFGTFAGGKLFGARGVWLQNMASADNQNFLLTDSTGATQNPPVQATITVANLLYTNSVGDAVSVFRYDSGSIKKDQFTMTTQSSGSGTIIVSETISTANSDIPTSGYIRVVRHNSSGVVLDEQRYYYSSWTGSTFTLASHTDGFGTGLSATTTQTYNATTYGDTAYVGYIDDAATTTSSSVTVLYLTDRPLLIRVRRYQTSPTNTTIQPFETPGSLTSAGASATAIRTPDSIAG